MQLLAVESSLHLVEFVQKETGKREGNLREVNQSSTKTNDNV